MSSLYITDTNPLTVVCVVNVFFQSVPYLFTFLMVSVDELTG